MIFVDLQSAGASGAEGSLLAEVAVVDTGGVRFYWRADRHGATGGEVHERLDGLFDEAVAVGHGVDEALEFVDDDAKRVGAPRPAALYVDTLRLARERLGIEADGFGLRALAGEFALDFGGQLTGSPGRARRTRRLFWHLVDGAGLITLADAGLLRINRKGL